jgi:voltage-gated potassium channel
MLFAQQAVPSVLLVILTLWLQCGGIALLIPQVRRALAGHIHRVGPFRTAALVVRLTTLMIVLHLLEILLWTACYRWVCFSSWDSAFYFSVSSYTTVGCGDVTLPLKWHMLGPLESMTGVLMCGISVSLLFAIATRLIGPERQRLAKYDPASADGEERN